MIEQPLTIQASNTKLSGTLCLPKSDGRFPIVIMIHGSGALDRNENAVRIKLNVFNAIAHHLADVGIASFRYDKRGCGKSTGNFYTAGHQDLVNDAISCFDAISQSAKTHHDQIFLLGHSEGTAIAPQIANHRKSVAGIIQLCPFIEDLELMLIKQAKYFDSSLRQLKGLKGVIMRLFVRVFLGDPVQAQLKFMKRVGSTEKSVVRFRLQKVPAKWLREMFQLNLPDIYQKTQCPALLIGGEKDLQCNPGDVDRISAILDHETEAHIIDNMTHILRCDDEAPSIFRYSNLIKKPIEREVVELISSWLIKRLENENLNKAAVHQVNV